MKLVKVRELLGTNLAYAVGYHSKQDYRLDRGRVVNAEGSEEFKPWQDPQLLDDLAEQHKICTEFIDGVWHAYTTSAGDKCNLQTGMSKAVAICRCVVNINFGYTVIRVPNDIKEEVLTEKATSVEVTEKVPSNTLVKQPKKALSSEDKLEAYKSAHKRLSVTVKEHLNLLLAERLFAYCTVMDSNHTKTILNKAREQLALKASKLDPVKVSEILKESAK